MNSDIQRFQLTLSQTTNYRLFQTQRYADDNFELDEYWQKVLQKLEDIVGKGEIGHYQQFLLLTQCFQKTCAADI